MDLEALDNALKASWQSVAMNMNMVRLLLITLAVFVAVYFLTKRISVSTLAGAAAFLIFTPILGSWLWGAKLFLAILTAAALVLPYWGNLKRYFTDLRKNRRGGGGES